MKKIFYGWRIVVAGGALQFLQSLLLNQAFGTYLAVLVEERGWSKTALGRGGAQIDRGPPFSARYSAG